MNIKLNVNTTTVLNLIEWVELGKQENRIQNADVAMYLPALLTFFCVVNFVL